MATQKVSLTLPPEEMRRINLANQFEDKFGKNPMLPPGAMPRELWEAQMREALETGKIPDRLESQMVPGGFVTSIQGLDGRPMPPEKEQAPTSPAQKTMKVAFPSEEEMRRRDQVVRAELKKRFPGLTDDEITLWGG